MLEPPKLPRGARLINAIGQPFARYLPQLSLREDQLLAVARSQTGLEDFGDTSFLDPLRRFVASLESQANLTPIGRTIARGEIVQALSNRLEMKDWRTRHPEIAREAVTAPMFIIGMPRTGTTILHELLMQDSGNRVPMTWEVEVPCPPPSTNSYANDPRIEEAQATIDRSESLIPDFKRMHRMGADLPQECVRILTTEMASMSHMITYSVPSYGNWLIEDYDWAPAYAAHRRFLQHLQWRCPGDRWVLKTPAHLWALPALLAEYPDARLIQTHRDPLRVLGSITSLGTTLRTMSSWSPNPRALAKEWADWNATALQASVNARESGLISAANIIDIQFAEFMAEPIATVQRIYDKFGIDLTAESESRMRAYLRANPSDKHGAHEYSFADTGLDESQERAKVSRYQQYFDVPSEKL